MHMDADSDGANMPKVVRPLLCPTGGLARSGRFGNSARRWWWWVVAWGRVASCRVNVCSTWHNFNDRLSRLNTRPGTRNKAEQPNKSVLHVCS